MNMGTRRLGTLSFNGARSTGISSLMIYITTMSKVVRESNSYTFNEISVSIPDNLFSFPPTTVVC